MAIELKQRLKNEKELVVVRDDGVVLAWSEALSKHPRFTVRRKDATIAPDDAALPEKPVITTPVESIPEEVEEVVVSNAAFASTNAEDYPQIDVLETKEEAIEFAKSMFNAELDGRLSLNKMKALLVTFFLEGPPNAQ